MTRPLITLAMYIEQRPVYFVAEPSADVPLAWTMQTVRGSLPVSRATVATFLRKYPLQWSAK